MNLCRRYGSMQFLKLCAAFSGMNMGAAQGGGNGVGGVNIMSDLISRDALLEDLRESVNWLHKIYGDLKYEDEKRICGAEIASFSEVIMRVKDAPAVDAVEVVRCKDCANRGDEMKCPLCQYNCYWNDYERCTEWDMTDETEDDGFCHRGVKKDAVD